MIANEYQYRLSVAQAKQFEKALRELETATMQEDVHPLLRQAERAGLASQRETLLSEIREYEELRAGACKEFSLDSLEELPAALIKIRIASGLTQKQLAERLGWKEQQIQKYEATGYVSASWKRLNQITQALGIQVQQKVSVK